MITSFDITEFNEDYDVYITNHIDCFTDSNQLSSLKITTLQQIVYDLVLYDDINNVIE